MNVLLAVGAFAATAAATFGAFKALEETSSPHARNDFSEWLTSPKKQIRTRSRFPQMFRAVVEPYATKMRVWKLLLITVVMSFVTLAVALPIAAFSSATCYACPTSVYEMVSDGEFWVSLFVFLTLGVLPDFVSLVKTKWLVFSKWFVRAPFFVFLLDVAISAGIAVGWIALCIKAALLLDLSDRPTVFLLPTLLTSMMPTVLTLAFLLFAFTTKMALRIFALHLKLSKNLLNIEEKPFQSVGLMMAPPGGLGKCVRHRIRFMNPCAQVAGSVD